MESEQKKIGKNPGACLKINRAYYMIWVTVEFGSFLLVKTYDMLISTASWNKFKAHIFGSPRFVCILTLHDGQK